MKSSENNCKHDELAGFGFAVVGGVMGFAIFLLNSFWSFMADDLNGVDVKMLLSILPAGDPFDHTDESALNELKPLVDWSLFALPQISFGDKSCGRSKPAQSDEKLSTEWFKMDDVGESQMLWPVDMAGDWICGGVYQTELLESFLIIRADCDSFKFGLSHRFDGVDVDFLNWFFNWSRCVLFGDDCVDAHSTSLLSFL